MKIEIEIEDYNIAYSFADDEGNMLRFEELDRDEQIKILNSFAQGYNFWMRFLKEDKK